jgi:small subunit ribosomal protein S1
MAEIQNSAGGTRLYMSKNLSKAQLEKQKVLAFLDQADNEVPANPGLPSEKALGEFATLFEQSVKEQDFKVGDVVTGTVVEVQTDYVLVDINYKSEGLIAIDEFRVVDGVRAVKPGDHVEVLIDRIENENGMVGLS